MAVRSSWPMNVQLVLTPETIVLDTREDLEIFESYLVRTENVKENQEYIEQILQELIMDLMSKEDANYSITYSAYELLSYSIYGHGYDDHAKQLSDFYEKLANKVLQRLEQLNAYRGDRLIYHYTRRLGGDIVLTRIRLDTGE